MGTFSIWHWLVVLLVVLLIFGTKKLRNMGSDLGGAVKGFKEAVKKESAEESGKIESADSRQTYENEARAKDQVKS